jgi:transcriptional regulator of acetoin/glycerol metabolism
LIAYYLGQGEGLTDQQIEKLSGLARRSALALIRSLSEIIDIRQDEDGIWAAYYGATPSQPRTPRQRHSLIAYELAIKGEIKTTDLARRLGIARNTVYSSLCGLSIVLPIYYDEHTRTWKVLTGDELD